MKNILQLLMLLAAVTAGSVSTFAQADSAKISAEIATLESQYDEAYKRLNASETNRLRTADYLMTARIPPRTISKEQFMAAVSAPTFKAGTIESLTVDDVKIRVYGDDTSIVTGSWRRTSKSAEGKDTSASGRFTRVWVKQAKQWLVAGEHYSPNMKPEKSSASVEKGN